MACRPRGRRAPRLVEIGDSGSTGSSGFDRVPLIGGNRNEKGTQPQSKPGSFPPSRLGSLDETTYDNSTQNEKSKRIGRSMQRGGVGKNGVERTTQPDVQDARIQRGTQNRLRASGSHGEGKNGKDERQQTMTPVCELVL
eukprot:scaffold1771_cov343-Pavlova_lutheri.AAC.27